ncbi:ABC-type multidrug transport system fused ATPase/permease subunit [Aequitasia blattaphilus]
MEPLVSTNTARPKDASVELSNVTFSYDGNKNALENISLHVKPGETIAFVGPSGGGKSTLASIISRFFDPQEGTVRIGGADVKDIPKEELMNTVSFVFQNSRLIKGTILENIRLGNPAAKKEEVQNALKAAQCMDIIEKFPKGLETRIGTEGIYLSGGEQQRLAIARAILKNSPIIVMDEAIAFADPDNENLIQEAFSQLAKGRTVIMIAHRLSTVRHADCIYVLKEGEIKEKGSFDDLNAMKGIFSNMWNDYQKSAEWKVNAI